MFEHARNLEFEKAAQVRDQLAASEASRYLAGGSANVVPFVPRQRRLMIPRAAARQPVNERCS